MSDIENLSSMGVLRTSLKIGVVTTVTAGYIKINLAYAGETSGMYTEGERYGRGEVGEFVLIEGQQELTLARLTEIRLPDRERNEVSLEHYQPSHVNAVGFAQLLGSVDSYRLKIQAGVNAFPRLGDRVYSAPTYLMSSIPNLLDHGIDEPENTKVKLELGCITSDQRSKVSVTPEKLFGRHCAILGTTGGGKSWTTMKIVEECATHPGSKVILIDPTSEYRESDPKYTQHAHLGTPLHKAPSSKEISVPPTDFLESDFIAIFDPSGKVQGPKLREAIKSLRLANLCPDEFPAGFIEKIGNTKERYRRALNKGNNSALVDKPSQPFDVLKLIKQVIQECCYDNGDSWGNTSNDLQYCSSLFTRIQAVIYSNSLRPVFKPGPEATALSDSLNQFLNSDKRVYRLCLSDLTYEFYAREVVTNVIGRKLMSLARIDKFREKPILVVLDEAHNFLGKRVGSEDNIARLDAFEMIAKEGRKYGLNICLSTQRPRDITEGVLSQMGTLLVHRLTNDRDREVVERACGEIDRSAAAFLPNLQQGEAALFGVDFPIPMTVQIARPRIPPLSEGPDFQHSWTKAPNL